MVNNTGAICLIEQKTGVFVAREALKTRLNKTLYRHWYIHFNSVQLVQNSKKTPPSVFV